MEISLYNMMVMFNDITIMKMPYFHRFCKYPKWNYINQKVIGVLAAADKCACFLMELNTNA